MILDPASLLIAIGAAATALTITLFASWLTSREDVYLLNWTAGLALIATGVVAFALSGEPYSPILQLLAFLLTLSGLSVLYAGARQFRAGTVPSGAAFGLWAGSTVAVTLAFTAGLGGFGTVLANVFLMVFFVLAGREYWLGRAEFPLPMTATAILYMVSGISFLPCAIVLMIDGEWTLDALPSNWAEDLNSLVLIVSMAAAGALALTLNQMRKTQVHQREALIDPLTDLLNRRAVFDLADRGDFDSDLAVVMFDIDHFKSINDRFGHAVGDSVLRRFADVLRQNMRETDSAARLGGEEFCLVLRGVEARAACDIAERIRTAFSGEPVLPETDHSMTVSGGVATARDADGSFEDTLRRADESLYAAKAAGRDRVQGPLPRLVA